MCSPKQNKIRDNWIGHEDEQASKILKCLFCGTSCKTLEKLTEHMRKTSHYKRIIDRKY